MTHASVRDATSAANDGLKFNLGDRRIQVQGSASTDKWNGLRIVDQATQRSINLADAFSLSLKDGSVMSSSSMKRTQPFVVHNLRPEPQASRYSDWLAGKEVCTDFNDPTTAAEVEWCGIVRDGSNYFRQQITIHTSDRSLPITDVRMLQFKDAGTHCRKRERLPGCRRLNVLRIRASAFHEPDSKLSAEDLRSLAQNTS